METLGIIQKYLARQEGHNAKVFICLVFYVSLMQLTDIPKSSLHISLKGVPHFVTPVQFTDMPKKIVIMLG